jgi:arylsulfatase A-like enzyme
MADRKNPLVQAAIGGFGFAVVEAAAAWIYPAPLDPVPSVLVAGLSVVGTTLIVVIAAVILMPAAPRAAGGLALALWAAVWGPHNAQLAGWHRVGWIPTVGMALAAPFWPGTVVLATLAGGASGSLGRFRGESRGRIAPDSETASGVSRPNMLLITVDTVRGDAGLMDLRKWGSKSPFSPVHGWTHFTSAYAPAPWTLPSVHSILTSLPVRQHGGGLPTVSGESRRFAGIFTLPYNLQQAGYETVAVVSNPHIAPEHGFADGFDRWFHSDESFEPLTLMHQWTRWKERLTGRVSELRHNRDGQLVRLAFDELARPGDRPRFVWVHLLGPHEYARDPATELPGWTPGTEDRRILRETYEANIGAARANVIRLAAAAQGWVVAVTSDHGEAFGEGDVWGHGKRLHDAELHVPLAIRRPGVDGGVITDPVAVQDLAHTLLAFAGRAGGFPGENLHTPRREPIEVGGVRHEGGTFAARTRSGQYVARKPGEIGPGVAVSAATREAIRALGYTD